MNFTTPYNTTDYFFTKENDYIQFNSPLFNTYFEITAVITSYEFYTEEAKTKTLAYKIPLFQNKASFLLGEVVDRSMTRMKNIDLRSLFQYKPTSVSLTIKEIDGSSETIINSTTINPIKFISGYVPEKVQSNCAFLDVYDLPRRTTATGIVFLNMILTPGTHPFQLKKNGLVVSTFSITVISTGICTRALKMGDYTAKMGDTFECVMINNPQLSKTFHIFPSSFYSNYIAFEDEYRLKSIIEFTGEYKFNTDFITKLNKVKKGLVETNNKIYSKSDISLTINTGFLLSEEQHIIESLLASQKAWIIIGENAGIELIPNTKKLTKNDPTTALFAYDVEFFVNALTYKPLLIAMDSPLVIAEQDIIAPTIPLNLNKIHTTTNGTSLFWDAATDAYGVTAYDIYKDGVFLLSTPNLTYPIIGLTAGTTYSFTVKAKDAAGNISSASIATSVTTLTVADVIAPTQPTALAASEITSNGLKLTWTASTDAVGVVKYNIYKGGIKIGETTTSLFYFVTGLSPNTSYGFYITAEDAAGNISIASSTITPLTLSSPTTSFYYEGIFDVDDYRFRDGRVTYIDSSGVTRTQSGLYTGTCTEIIASSIVSTYGVMPCL